MSIVERALYWIAIVVLIVSLIGIKGNISDLESKIATATAETQSEE